MVQALGQSLRRLQTEHADISCLHRGSAGIRLEEPLRALDDRLRSGKIRYSGLCNFRGWRIAELVHLAARLGMPGPVVCQPHDKLLNRMPAGEIRPACQHHGIGVAPYSPVARGVLTGNYRPGAAPEAGSRAGRGGATSASPKPSFAPSR